MKTFTIVIALFLFILYPNQTEAQITKGSFVIEGYYGNSIVAIMPNYYIYKIENISLKKLGPLGLRFEYMLTNVLGVGLDGVYREIRGKYSYLSIFNQEINVSYVESKTRIMFRMNFHFVKHKLFDAYAGYGVGYKNTNYNFISTSNEDGSDGSNWLIYIPFAFRISSGFRYFFTENIGIHAEVGIGGGSLITGGLSYIL